MSDPHEVYLFWDIENCPVYPPEIFSLAAKIDTSLLTLDARLHLAKEKYVAGNLNWLNKKDKRRLERYGYVFESTVGYHVHCSYPECKEELHWSTKRPEKYDRVKEVADRMIVQRLQLHLLKKTVSRNILLVSGDADFAIPLDFLKDKKYNVFLAIGDNSKQEFKYAAHYTWKWAKMELGGATTIWRS